MFKKIKLMRKTLLISGVLILLFLVGIYLFIPATITIHRSIRFSSSDINLTKYLRSSSGWGKWWPEENSLPKKEKNTEFCYQSFCYQVLKMTNTGAEIQLINNTTKSNSKLTYVAIGRDSIEVSWETRLENGFSPVGRIMNYQKALKITKNTDEILSRIEAFFDNEKLVYGLDVKGDIVRNKLLLTKEKTSAEYPDMNFVYDIIADLRKNIKRYDAREMASPMLSIYKPYKQDYIITVAIPIDKEIPFTQSISIRKMVDGKLLFTEVKGGPKTVENKLSSFHQYVKDKRLISPAMPYEMMITDRIQVPDTSQWITRIYYPVF